MRLAVIAVLLVQLTLTVIGCRVSPDYYSRTPASVQAWAYSKGLWILVLSLALSMILAICAYRMRSGWGWTAATLSVAVSLVWFVRPYLFSLIGDLLFWRFP